MHSPRSKYHCSSAAARRTPANTHRPRTLPPLIPHHITTQIIWHSSPIRIPQIHIAEHNIRTGRHSTTLQADDTAIPRGPPHPTDIHIADLKLAIRAIALPRCPNKPRALADRERRAAHALCGEIAQHHVLCEAAAATASIGRVPVLVVGPRLDVEGVQRVLKVDVLCADVLDGFEAPVVLPDGADGYAEAVVEGGVEQGDVSAIGFAGEGVVAVVDGPVTEEQVRREESVCAVGVCWGVSMV